MKNFNLLSKMCSPLVGSQSSEVGFDYRLTVGSPSGLDTKWMLKLVSVLVLILTVGVGNVWGTTNNGDLFERISAAPSANDEVIFVNQLETYACGTTQNDNNRTPVAITTSSNQYIYNSSNSVQVFVVKIYSGNYGFHTGSGYLYSGSSTKNHLKTNSTSAGTNPSGTAAWSISVSSNVFSVTNSSNTSYYLAFNGTSYFSQYKLDQIKPYIYKKVMSAPTGVAASSITSSGATITITDATSVNNYELYYSTSSTAPNASSSATTTITGGKSKSITGLNASTTYYVWARAYSTSPARKTGWVALTGTSFTTSSGVVCSAPNAPTNGSVSGTGVTISTTSAAANYDIYLSTSSTTPTTEDPTASTSSANSKAISDLNYGTTYYYWMRQNCGSSTSSWVAGSPATSFTTTVPAPTGLSMTPSLYGVTFGITDANNVNNYEIYYSTTNSAPGASPSGTATTTTKSKEVTGLPASTTYYCWVRAKGPNANSSWYSAGSFATLTLSSISVSTAPTKTKYLVGDNFDPTGLVITRTYSNSTSDTYSYAGHTSEFSFSPATNAALTAGDDAVTITYGGQTVDQSINVYTVTVNKVNMSGTAISAAGVTASCSGRTLSQSVGSTNYKFEEYAVTAGGVTISTNTITGTPTGNVTINAKFHDPITVTKGTGTGASTFSISASEIKYNGSVTVTCAAAAGYKNQWTLTVTPSDGATYDANGSTTSITISNITKDITVDLAYTECTDHGASSITGGASDGDDYGPIHAYFKYSTSQILYTKSDLDLARGKKGSIKSIYFQYSGAAAMASRTIKIYMANTTLSSLTTTKYVPYASFSEVYDGSFSCSSAGWYEIILDTPFEYDGVANLVVMVDDNSNSYEDEKNFKYHSATGAQIFKRQDSGDINPSSWTPTNAIDSRPNTKFCIEEDNMDEYTVNWYVNGSIEHTQTGYEGETLTSIPTPVSGDCDGTKAFVGWYDDTYTHDTDAPDFVEPEVIPGGDANYYAVFANVSGSDVYTEQTSDITSEGVYVLVSEYSSSYSYMPNTESSTNPTLGTGITMTTSAGVTTLTNKVTRAMLWDFTEDDNYTNYFHVRPHGDATIGLGTTSSTGANIRITADYKDDSFTFTTTDADQKWDIYNGHYLAVYSGSDWRNYSNNTTNQNGVFHIFKQTSSATYSNFATSCCTALGQPATLTLEKTAHTIKATWTATSGGNETGYSVQLYDNSGGDKGSTIGDPVSRTSSQLTYTFEGLTANHKYYVGVTPTYSGAGDYCATGTEKLVSVTTDQVYTVTYNGGGGSGTMTDSNSPYEAGEEVTVKENTFTKSGYTFTAWSYSPAVTVTDGKFEMPSSNVVITATWTAKKNYYVDRMHGNCDGVNTVTIDGVVYNCYLREGAGYTRPDLTDNDGGTNDCVTGHAHFIGWVAAGNISADGSYSSGTIYAGGSSGTATTDGTIYYAVWAEE